MIVCLRQVLIMWIWNIVKTEIKVANVVNIVRLQLHATILLAMMLSKNCFYDEYGNLVLTVHRIDFSNFDRPFNELEGKT